MTELLVAVKLLKSAIGQLSDVQRIDGHQTLRSAFMMYVNEPAVIKGDTGTEFELEELKAVSKCFGDAISAIMTINRCVISLNSEKLAEATLKKVVHNQAVAQTGRSSAEFAGQSIQVELDSGELVTIPPDVEFAPLVQISMDLPIEQLSNWKAVGTNTGSWRARR